MPMTELGGDVCLYMIYTHFIIYVHVHDRNVFFECQSHDVNGMCIWVKGLKKLL
jgi:hypothetical protein